MRQHQDSMLPGLRYISKQQRAIVPKRRSGKETMPNRLASFIEELPL